MQRAVWGIAIVGACVVGSVLECSVPARGFVRDAAGHIEIGIRDASWLRFALASRRPRILVVVKRDRQEVWSDEFPLVLPVRGT